MNKRKKHKCDERMCRDCKYAERGPERALDINGKKTVFETYVCSRSWGGEYCKKE